MKIEARFRRRAEAGESLSELHSGLLNRLSRVAGLWSGSKVISDVHFDAGSGESAAVDFSPCLIGGIKGAISYASRLPAAIVDKAVADDSLVIQLDTDTVDFQRFSREIFPELVRIFNPYRAAVVTDLDQDLDDFEDIVKEAQITGRDVDGRDTVFRLQSVNYFDDTMCIRAFGINADQVVNRLRGSIPLAEHLQSGALLVVSKKPVVGEQLIALDVSIRVGLAR